MEEVTELEGFVDHIIYRNAENGYTVLVLSVDYGEETVVGCFRAVEEGEGLYVKGGFIKHSSYGEQFQMKEYEIREPEDLLSIERYLASGTIKGIGGAIAKRIVKKFREDTFRIMEEEPERLTEIKGISERIAREISAQVEEKRGMRKAMIFLQHYGISMSLSTKIYAFYDQKLYEVLQENPYRLTEDITGIGFQTADEIAQKIGIHVDSVFRIRSGVLYSLQQAQMDGHIYLPEEILIQRSGQLLNVDPKQIKQQIENLVVEGKLICKSENHIEKIYESMCYYLEMNCAKLLSNLYLKEMKEKESVLSKILQLEEKSGILLDDRQREGVVMAATNGVSVITGGPGTGKTTIIHMLLQYFSEEGMDILLAAPTGRAAKRMTETTGYESKTIHRLLEIGAEGIAEFGRDETNPLEADAIIIDEMSMVDIFLFHALLKAISIGTRLILVGDVNQLPSVGAGSVLKDIIDSQCFPIEILTKIFRQAAQSDIVVNAHKIHEGEQIALNNKSKDFFFLERNQADVILEAIIYLVSKKLPPYVNAKPYEIQVLTPMRKGLLGVENLNRRLQERLNPAQKGKLEKEGINALFREGDKVMQVKNNYQMEWQIISQYGIVIDRGQGIFNGDMGIVTSIDHMAESVEVEFDEGRRVQYSFPQLDELELAYAITIHKSQGSEYPAVVIPLLSGPQMLMSRNLLYTAVTRAKTCVTLIGSSETVLRMIENKKEQVRYTGLKERIQEIMGEPNENSVFE